MKVALLNLDSKRRDVHVPIKGGVWMEGTMNKKTDFCHAFLDSSADWYRIRVSVESQ